MGTEIHGFCDLRFAPMRDAFAQNFEDGLDVGASLAITHKGAFVADLWAGHYDPDRTRAWERDTIVNVASTTKIMAIMSLLMLIDRGKVELDAPVARYWPDFAQGGKAHVTVRDAITHQAGVPGLRPQASAQMACDWDAMVARIAAEPHWYGGDRRLTYHVATYGFVLGGLIQHVDGRTPGRFFREEIAEKCGADFTIGFKLELLPRTAIPIVPEGAFAAAGELMNAIDNSNIMTLERAQVENPGSNGTGNGRSIARACAIIAKSGQLDGVRFLSPGIIAEAGREQVYAQCPYLGWLRMGLGFGLDSKEFGAPSASAMHWGGFGGSWAMADPVARVSVGFAPNKWSVPPAQSTQLEFGGEPRLNRFMLALRPILKALADEH